MCFFFAVVFCFFLFFSVCSLLVFANFLFPVLFNCQFYLTILHRNWDSVSFMVALVCCLNFLNSSFLFFFCSFMDFGLNFDFLCLVCLFFCCNHKTNKKWMDCVILVKMTSDYCVKLLQLNVAVVADFPPFFCYLLRSSFLPCWNLLVLEVLLFNRCRIVFVGVSTVHKLMHCCVNRFSIVTASSLLSSWMQ